MLERLVRGVRRPRLSRAAGRALGLAGFSAGLWLLGQGTASAEVPPPVPVPAVVSAADSLLGTALSSADSLLTRTTEAALPVVAEVSAPAVEVVHRVVPPVVTAVVAPVVSVVDGVLAPVVDPVLPRVDQVLDPLLPVVPSAHGDVAVQPVAQPAPGDPGAAAPSSPVQDFRTGAVPTASITGDDAEQPLIPAAPLPYPALPVGSPASVGGSTPTSPEQPSADLSAAVLAAGAAALAAIADDACDAAGNVAFDPSFSPD